MTKTLTIIFLLLVPTALCQWIEGMSTYIEPEFPPSGAISFQSHGDYWNYTAFSFSILSVLIGGLFLFGGYYWETISKWGAGFLFSISLVFLGFCAISLSLWWVGLILGFIFGLIFAWIMACFPVTLTILAGFICGFLLVVQFIGAFFGNLWDDDRWFYILLWVASSFAGLFGATICYFVDRKYHKGAVIATTSIIGAFLITVGLDFFAQDQFGAVIINLFRGMATDPEAWWISLIMYIIWIALALLGAAMQWFNPLLQPTEPVYDLLETS